MRKSLFGPLFALLCLIHIEGGDEPQGGTPLEAESLNATDENVEHTGEDEPTTEVVASESDAPAMQAEPGVDATPQQASDDSE